MATIYRTDSTIQLKVDGLKVKVSPLTFQQKMDVQSVILEGGAMSAMKGAALALRYTLKDIQGIKDESGDAYELDIENGMVSEQCMDELFNMEESTKLTLISLNLLQGIPKSFVDPNTGEKIDGVQVVKERQAKKK